MRSFVLCTLYFVLHPFAAALAQQTEKDADSGARPNILWISLEDISPDFGCYGDPYARTPLFDRFAHDGIRFTRVFTHAPVCAPSRSGIITGMYPTSIGTHHMRCKAVTPPEVKCFTEYLRAAGYYCTNNAKTDYQFDPPFTAWDENGNRAHWRGRKTGQPFFAVFNFTNTHESQVRDPSPQTKSLVQRLPDDQRHDPAKATLPPYYPDTPVVRRDWANYHDNVTAVEQQVAKILDQLNDDGLAENTIVWIWGDHGRGLPRGKRWIYDSGIQMPLLIQVPQKWRSHAGAGRANEFRPGAVIDDLIAAIDFGPTVLSLARVEVPKHMHGRPFLGPQRQPPQKYVFAARDRMDERYDVIRAVRDNRFKYIRNLMPHLQYAQHIGYMDLMPTMQEMRRLHAQNKLEGPAALFFRKTKPVEELYDTAADPHEVNNLAGDPSHADKLKELRQELARWMLETGDLGLIPEPILDEAQRPGAKWNTTQPPQVIRVERAPDGAATISLGSSTPGSSIGYRSRGDSSRAWSIYDRPVTLKLGETLLAKACRIGFRDSQAVELSAENRPLEIRPRQPLDSDWRPAIADKQMLARLLALKEHDRDPAGAIDVYKQSLTDAHPAIRYWSVVGLMVAVGDEAPPDALKDSLTKLTDTDTSPVVRIAAGHTLARWGEHKKAMPILVAGLDDPQPAVQLHAAHAIEALGETARPLLPRLKQLVASSSEYVQRVAAHTVRQLQHD